MAKFDTSFNFGANVKQKKPKAGGKKGGRKKTSGKKSNAWRAYSSSGKRR